MIEVLMNNECVFIQYIKLRTHQHSVKEYRHSAFNSLYNRNVLLHDDILLSSLFIFIRLSGLIGSLGPKLLPEK